MSVFKIKHKITGEFMGTLAHNRDKGTIPWVRDGGRTWSDLKYIKQFLQRTSANIDYDRIEVIEYELLEKRVVNPRTLL